MIDFNRPLEDSLRIEASAESLRNSEDDARTTWWLMAGLGSAPSEDHILCSERRGQLIHHHHGTLVFALGEQLDVAPSSTRAALYKALTRLETGNRIRGGNGGRLSAEQFAQAAASLIDDIGLAAGAARTNGDSTAIALIHWPSLFYVADNGVCAYLQHDGRVRRLRSGDDDAVGRQHRGDAAVGRTASAATQVSNGARLARVDLAFGDSLLLTSAGVGHVVADDYVSRTLRAGNSAKAATSALLEICQRDVGPHNATVLAARFAFRNCLPIESSRRGLRN
jgi:hypothetical protein